MPEFDWSLIKAAAERWMAEHPNTQPRWLVLPPNTPEAIQDLATEIYDVPVVLDDIEVPWFSTATLDQKPDLTWPGSRRFSVMRLRELAQTGQLTAEDINGLSMEEYAAVRDILLRRVPKTLRGIKKL